MIQMYAPLCLHQPLCGNQMYTVTQMYPPLCLHQPLHAGEPDVRRDPDEGEPPEDGGGQVVVGQQGVEVVVGLAAHVACPVHVGGQPQGPGVCVVASPHLALADECAQQDGRGDGQRQGETAHLQDHKAGD